MALQKTVTSTQGVSSNYHRIDQVKFYIANGPKVIIELALFKDATAAASDSKLDNTEYEVEGSDYTTYFAPAVLDVTSQNPQERAYVYLKTLTTPIDFTTGTTDV